MAYIDQLTIYLDILGQPEGFILFKNKNDGEIKIKEVKYEKDIMTSILTRISLLHKAIKSKQLLERPFERNSFQCKTCVHRLVCWKLPMERKLWGFQRLKEAPQGTLAV